MDISEAGSYDQLGHVPPESFTKEVLLCCNAEGQTLVDVMAEKNRLNLVPRPALKEALAEMGLDGVEVDDLLTLENADGELWGVLRERLAASDLV